VGGNALEPGKMPPRGRWQTPNAEPHAPTRLPEWVTAVLDAEASSSGLTAIRLVPGSLVPGTRYRIQGWLGDGGMGVVYEAEHTDVDRRVAVKILRSEVCELPDIVERFRQEARAANKVGSVYITEVYDFAELPDDRLLIAMELLEGQTVATTVARGGPMELGRAVGILRQLCKGLADAHDAGIVHRDIKPDNIMLVRRNGRADYVKIMDLGIATLLVDGRAVASRMVGTPHYVAPEIVGGRTFDHRVDVYAVGCTAFEMLVGRPPFDGDSIPAILMAHLEREAELPSVARGDDEIPEAIDRVIMRCLSKHPEDRFTDMRDLEAALCEAQMEAGFQTPWDDLPAPDVDDERKEKILRGMPDPKVLDRPQWGRWVWSTVAAVAALAVLATGWYWSPSRQLTEIERDQVEELVKNARAAAARTVYIVPVEGDPEASTAYAYIVDLEHAEGPSATFAREQAQRLRTELGQTLAKLGDRYWGADGGRVFAAEYYAQALVFDPGIERAWKRSHLDEDEVAALRAKADAKTFSRADLPEPATPNDVRELLRVSAIDLDQGEIPRAARLAERAVALEPRNPDCREQLARAYEHLNRPEDAAHQREMAERFEAGN
jgi:serine/threonine protein kinase